jgi:glutamine amidotransferase-like uncharacterized protein
MMEGISAASAADDNSNAAPAAIINFTLRIGFVLLSGEANNGGPTLENSRTQDGSKCLSAT